MKIGILGSGPVGKALAKGFAGHGYDVMIGTRDLSKLNDWHGKKGSFEETAKFGELIVLAVKGAAAKEVLKIAGAEGLKDKTIIDTTNPIADAPPVNGVLKFFTTLDNSLMEQLQTAFPHANFVKAFNSVGNSLMVNPSLESKPTMFICGNNDNSKSQVSKILDQFGFEVEDMGKVESARAIEPLCILWCIPGFLKNDWTHAFKILKK